jgi:cytochrome c553
MSSIATTAVADEQRYAKQMFTLCATCHGDHGEGRRELEAPSIAGLPEWYIQKQLINFKTGVRGRHAKDLPGLRMRPMGRHLTDKDIPIMAKYVSEMKRPHLPTTVKGLPFKGESAYAVCIACHGAQAEGNQSVGAPTLIGISDWYALTQLKNFKSGIRGGNAELDPMGASMKAIANTLDEETMHNLVAYIQMLSVSKQGE